MNDVSENAEIIERGFGVPKFLVVGRSRCVSSECCLLGLRDALMMKQFAKPQCAAITIRPPLNNYTFSILGSVCT